ncbi:hypothetical protein [Paenibacillus sp. FJAT-26967]|uniref:hypothetical protein n=1 Tax=Paenibacillus sp. FJAT-26967 TaxID=1729690 RepID=UPI000837ADF8|nr:hypothetical protein [Paenibacillus sp. FJAT-26967]
MDHTRKVIFSLHSLEVTNHTEWIVLRLSAVPRISRIRPAVDTLARKLREPDGGLETLITRGSAFKLDMPSRIQDQLRVVIIFVLGVVFCLLLPSLMKLLRSVVYFIFQRHQVQ